MPAVIRRLWPVSLKGQVLLAIALALLLAQGLSAALLYRAEHERREAALLHMATVRIIAATKGQSESEFQPPPQPGAGPGHAAGPSESFRFERTTQSPLRPGEQRIEEGEHELREILADQGLTVDQLVVLRRNVESDARAMARLQHRRDLPKGIVPRYVVVIGVHLAGAPDWLVVRVFIPRNEHVPLHTLLAQTLFIYAVLFGAMVIILRRITGPLAKLTGRLERFAETRDPGGQIEPEGPEDLRRLITAHNAMEARIVGLLDEKDVMLGAIGHDLKTPLAALRVRIECVGDDVERERMARTIEDIARTLDDILSLARVGRPSDPAEQTELSALVASVVEEYEDMGEPVALGASERQVMPVRPTWIRRALRNLIGNGLRYGSRVSVTLERETGATRICISDHGPGIPEDRITQMLEPFTRGEPSRNSETGGAGLGLTLARAIAEQHGGTLTLSNRRDAKGAVEGLDAVIRLPLVIAG